MGSAEAATRLGRAIMVGATGRNAGKTEFACRLIRSLSHETVVHAVKVTTVYDTGDAGTCARGGAGCGVCTQMDCDLVITDEFPPRTGSIAESKDTGKMGRAGASRVWWVRVLEPSLDRVAEQLAALVPADGVLVIESNAARNVVEPDLFFMVAGANAPPAEDKATVKPSARQVIHFADEIVASTGSDFSIDPGSVRFAQDRAVYPRHATAILLAGGRSVRMGADKRFLRLAGVPMVERAHRALVGTFDEILVSCRDSTTVLPGVNHVVDRTPDAGPMGGVISALAESANRIAFVTACDIPDIPLDFVQFMLRRARTHEIVVPVLGSGRYEPLFAVYSRDVLPRLRKLFDSGERRIRAVYDLADTCCVPVPPGMSLENLNTRAEFTAYASRHI